MNYVQFISLFAIAGLVIPLAFQIVWWLVDRYLEFNLNSWIYLENIMLLLWPSSLMMLPAGSDEQLWPFSLLISTIFNIVFYFVIGTGVWFGVKKNLAILVLIIFVLIVIYWRLLTL